VDSITDSHGKYLDSVKQTGHYGLNGQTLEDRFKYFRLRNISENICNTGTFTYSTKDFKPILVCLLVDSGIEDRGHRKNLLNPESKFIGIYTSKRICIQNFAY